jgi:Ca2+-binding EF-hand superfamily protein
MNKTLLGAAFAGILMIWGVLPAAAQDKAAGAKSADETFTSLDANKDQKLNQAEFNKRVDATKQATSDADKATEFAAWDADKDGAISKAEFMAKYTA